MQLRVGVSGFYYADWPGIIYPEGTKSKDFFEAYTKLFDTVELNSTFYHFPSSIKFEQWRLKAPNDFQFAVKASRIITHFQKLNDVGLLVNDFVKNASTLEDKLGPILFQLPPGLAINEVLLENFLLNLPSSYRFTIEFRNPSWFHDDVFALLRHYGVAFCIYDFERRLSPIITTANFVYVRLHGPAGKYRGNYDEESLHFWASQIKEWQQAGLDVYFYFDNTFQGLAAKNALMLKKLLKEDVSTST